MNDKDFLKNSDHTGRSIIVDIKTGRKFYVEPIDNFNRNSNWGDINPATHKVEGEYGKKYKGSVTESESMVTKENEFDYVIEVPVGHSVCSTINRLLKNNI